MTTTTASAPNVAAEEARLAHRAVAGDGDAFAELYRRYEKRAYNLCLRILGSEDDAADATQEAFVSVLRRLPGLEGRDLAFGSYLFTSARHACYDLIDRRRRAEPSDTIPESSIPVGGGVGGGGVGFDPGDPDDDPERNVLQQARSEEIRVAHGQLPERQREVLALRELEDLSYDEIAEIMDMNRNSVAQLISRARISLRDALRGTALASVATSSADCERALALIAASQDGQDAAGDGWLDDHLAGCETCRLSREAMQEAGLSYRAWLPIAAAPFLFRETMARAAETVGADWSEATARHDPGATAEHAGGLRATLRRHRRIDLILMGVVASLLLLVVLTARTHEGTPKVDPVRAADETTATAAEDQSDEPADAAQKTSGKRDNADGGDSPRALAAEPDDPSSDTKSKKDAPQATGDSAPTSNGAGKGQSHGQNQSHPDRGGSVGHKGDGGGGGNGLAGDPPTVTTPPPADPPATVAPDPPTTPDPTPPSTGQCRDANGNPTQCPPRQPPPVRCPTGCIRIPPATSPPR